MGSENICYLVVPYTVGNYEGGVILVIFDAHSYILFKNIFDQAY